jgi:hypothetical protein
MGAKKMDFFDAARIVAGTNREIRYKYGPWLRITTEWTFKDSVGNKYLSPTPEQQKEKAWEVEPEKKIFVWGACDDNEISLIHNEKPYRVNHEDGAHDGWESNGAFKLKSKNLFPKDKPQKFRLVPADQSMGIPWRKFEKDKMPKETFNVIFFLKNGENAWDIWLEDGFSQSNREEFVEYYCPISEIPKPGAFR